MTDIMYLMGLEVFGSIMINTVVIQGNLAKVISFKEALILIVSENHE